MNVNFLGDLHAQRSSVYKFKKNVIQIGDLDLCGYDWWGYQFSTKEEWQEAYGDASFPSTLVRPGGMTIEKGNRFFIDGNHDFFPALNPDAEEPYYIRPRLVYIPRGYVSGATMFIGGGESIDKDSRIPYYTWFPEERFNYVQENRILGYSGKIEAIVSHDLPISAATRILSGQGIPRGFHSSHFLEEVWKQHKPKVWIFGHFHMDKEFELEIDSFSTRFICCNIAQTKVVNIPLAPNFFKKEWKSVIGRDKISS